MRLIITDSARSDLRTIARYSEREWGPVRKRRYLAAIQGRLRSLLHNPELGGRREDVDRHCRCLPVGRHVIFYRIRDVVVVRVLHQRMDVRLHF